VRFGGHEHAARLEQEHLAGLCVIQPRVDLEAYADLVGVESAQDAGQAALGAVQLVRDDGVPGSEGLKKNGGGEWNAVEMRGVSALGCPLVRCWVGPCTPCNKCQLCPGPAPG
jgi:hypothetical protein